MAGLEETRTATQSGWGAQTRITDLDYLTQVALQETQSWIELVTKKQFKHVDDFRRSLQTGILLCELLNGLRPGTIRKINRLPTPIAGLDNINIFLEACQTHFGLKDSQLFHSCDLEDLSTRAVSDCEDQLKLETDRRLRNVAITIFWLGKVSRKYNFHGPQLDLSVFTDLVHGAHSAYLYTPPPTPSLPSLSPSIENISRPSLFLTPPRTPSQAPSVENVSAGPAPTSGPPQDESCDSIDRSSAYGSYRSEAKNSQSSDSFLEDVNHQREDSYEWTDRSVTSDYNEDISVSGSVYNTSMPVRHDFRRPGAPAPRLPDARYSASLDAAYGDRHQPSHNNNNHKDSHDGFEPLSADHRSGSNSSLDRHVRENDMLRSRLRTQTSVSGSSNPLQFVKGGGNQLAEKAKETVEVMEKQKEKKVIVETQEEDWQSNLSSWKHKMRKKSSSSLQRSQDADDWTGSQSLDDETVMRRKSKTFKEMIEEREKRQSGGYNIYPQQDEEEATFTSEKSQDTSPWKKKENDDKLTAFGFTRVDTEPRKSTFTERTSSVKRQTYLTGDILDDDHSRSAGYNNLQRSSTLPAYGSATYKSDSDNFNVSKKTDLTKTGTSYCHPDTFGAESDSSVAVTRKSVIGQSSQDGNRGDKGNIGSGKIERRSAPRAKGGFSAWSWERKSMSVEEDQEEPAVAAWALDEDEQQNTSKTVNEPSSKQTAESQSSFSSFRGGSATFPRESVDQSEPRFTKIPVQHEKSSSLSRDSGADFRSARNMFERSSVSEDLPPAKTSPLVRKPAAWDRSPVAPPAREDVVITRTVRKSYEFTEQDSEKTPGEWSRKERPSSEWSRKENTEHVQETRKTVERQSSHTDKQFIEKVIKISQKPNHVKGFGFTIRGGKEFSSPIKVEKVILGGAADVCELMPGDEIVAINGASVSNHYKDSVELVINQAVRLGQIELRIRRSVSKLGAMDEEDMQMEEEQKSFRQDSFQSSPASSREHYNNPVRVQPAPWEKPAASQPAQTPPKPAPRPAPKPAPRPTQSWQKQEAMDVAPPTEQYVSPPRDQFVLPSGEPPVPAPREQLDQRSHFQPGREAYEIMVERSVSHSQSSSAQGAPVGADIAHGLEFADADDIELEKEIMDQLEAEEDEAHLGGIATDFPERPATPEPSDEPPPLPAAPPPAPNWDTFPGQPTSAPADLSFLDPSDLVPDSKQQEKDSIQSRMDNLRRKSEFLGRNMEDTDEFRKLKEELDREYHTKDEETEWQKIEQKEHLSASNLMSRFDQLESPRPQVTEETHVYRHERTQSEPQKEKDVFDLQREEEEILQRLQQVGKDAQRRQDEIRREESLEQRQDPDQWSQDQIKGWKSMEQLPPHEVRKVQGIDVQTRTSLDMDSVLHNQPKLDIKSSHRFFDLEAERKRMQEWTEDQEKKLKNLSWNSYGSEPQLYQEQFERDQQRLKRDEADDLKHAHEIESEKKKQEEKLLEKELARQRELEEIKKKRDEVRRQEQLEDEEEERKRQKVLAQKRREEKEKERIRLERERLKQKEEEARRQLEEQRKKAAELRTKEAERKKQEAEELRRKKEEQQRREEELKAREVELQRQDEEQKRQAEEERKRREEQALDDKAEQLRLMEERLKQEEERLRREKEIMQAERERAQFRTGEVSASYRSRDAAQTGELEYVQERLSPERLDNMRSTGAPEQSRTVITDRTERYELRPAPRVAAPVVPTYQDSSPSSANKVVKKEPPIPPKPSIKTELSGLTRKDIIDMNKRPGASSSSPSSSHKVYEDTYRYSGNSPQMRVRQETKANRKSWSPDTAATELSYIKKHPELHIGPNGEAKGMSRQEVLALNRKAFARKEYASTSQANTEPPPSPTTPTHSMTRRDLHSLGAAPKSRLMSNEQWIREDPKKAAKRSEVMRQSLTSLSDHWLIEEAERRRIAEHTGQERPSVPSKRQGDVDNAYGENADLTVLSPPQGYPVSRLSRSWQGSREQTPQRSSHGGWEEGREDSPQRSTFSYSQKQASMSTFRAPNQGVTLITEVDKPEYSIKPQRPIPEDIKQTLLDRVHNSRNSQSYSQLQSPTYAYPHISQSSSNLYQHTGPSSQSLPYQHQAPYHSGSQQSVEYSTGSSDPSQYFQYPAQFPHTGAAAGRGVGPKPQSHEHPASSSGSVQSWDRVPPVPPKPPRLMSSDSEESYAEQVVSVSGSQRCSHCESPLGLGAAMVIESLNLHYHMKCFRCCVCQHPLGTAYNGADVRVRVSKLHCANCYSNDEVGLKYSRV